MGFSLKGIILTGRFVMNVIAEAAQQLAQYTRDTVLLLKGEGANNQTNNVFLDSSSNNLPVTRAGNVTQGSFTPFSRPVGEWSTKFSGNDRLSVPTQTLAGDFTVECWFLQTEKSTNYVPLISDDTGTYNFPVILDYQGSGYVGAFIPGSGAISSGKKVFEMGVWNHIATVRSGSTISVYVNGTRVVTGTGSSVVSVSKIGGYSTTGFFFKGMLSNVRVSTSALYIGESFTESTSPLTSTTGTVLLTCQSNNFVDRSPLNNLITLVNTPKVTAQSPFAFTEYNTATMGGSAYFDGAGDYLSVADNQALEMESSDFTIEGWVYPTAAPGNINAIVGKRANSGAYGNIGIAYWNNGGIGLYVSSTNGMPWNIFEVNGTSTQYYQFNAWNHFALVRQGSSWAFYVNGARTHTATSNLAVYNNGDNLTIGAGAADGAQPIAGHLHGVRIVKGTALYNPANATLTLPTAPAVAVTNTSLLLDFTNAGIVDSTGKNTWETIGSTKVSTAEKKFGTSSIAFNGTTDYIKAPTAQGNFAFGTGDFTVEGWIYRNNVSTNAAVIAIDKAITGNTFYIMYWAAIDATKLSVVTAASPSTGALTSSIATQANTWHHFAVTRQNGLVRIFMDGVLGASATLPTFDVKDGNSIQIGAHNGSYQFNGYIDNLRITKGQALYTANFTPPGAL